MNLIEDLWVGVIDGPVLKLLMNMGEALVWDAGVFSLGLCRLRRRIRVVTEGGDGD